MHYLEESLEEVAGNTLNGVINRQHVDALAILDVGARRYYNYIAKAHLEDRGQSASDRETRV